MIPIFNHTIAKELVSHDENIKKLYMYVLIAII